MDLTLIRWMLGLTPAERLQVLQGTIRSLERLKEELGGEKDRAVLPVLRRTLEERDRHE